MTVNIVFINSSNHFSSQQQLIARLHFKLEYFTTGIFEINNDLIIFDIKNACHMTFFDNDSNLEFDVNYA